PVLAGPPGVAYRARKFARRHRIAVAASAAALAALLAFTATLAIQARRIARERNRAERVSAFMTDLFKVSNPSEARGNAVTAREILDKGVEKIGRELADE